MIVKRVTEALSKIIFADLCCICKNAYSESGCRICSDCESQLNFITEPFCGVCGKPFINKSDITHTCGECLKKKRYYSKARSVFVYDGIIRNKIVEFKFLRNITLAKLFSEYVLGYVGNELGGGYDAIIPVPLHKRRLEERYFNQALLMVNLSPELLQIKVDKYSLKRIKYTKPQVLLKGAERAENVKGAFALSGDRNLSGERILLVDDIYTTGATVNECSRVLMKAGAGCVDVLTLAKTVFNG